MPPPNYHASAHRTAASRPAPEKSKGQDAEAETRKAARMIMGISLVIAVLVIFGGLAILVTEANSGYAIPMFVVGVVILFSGWIASTAFSALAAIVANTKASAENTKQILTRLAQGSHTGF